MPTKKYQIEIRKSKAKQPYRVLYFAKNGELLNTSENLSSVAAAIKNIKSVAKIFGIGKKGSELLPIEVKVLNEVKTIFI